MKPFLIGSQLPPDPVAPVVVRVTDQGKVMAAMSSGAWLTRKQIEQVSGLSCGSVNTVLQHGIRRGSIEREMPRWRGCTKAITQRYRVAQRGMA